jgi:hypothetical protein
MPLAAVGLRAYFRIVAEWQLTQGQARKLLGISIWRFYAWRAFERSRLSVRVVRRISFVLGIYRTLHTLFADPAQANAWPKKPNQAFHGRTAIERMSQGDEGLQAVSDYLKCQL